MGEPDEESSHWAASAADHGDLEHNGKGGEVTMITARTCTNELTVPDYGVSGRELAQRLLRLLEAYEVLPQFDTI